jgi:hypothetical protein
MKIKHLIVAIDFTSKLEIAATAFAVQMHQPLALKGE